MSLQIINSSPLNQSALIGNNNTLFIEVTSNNLPLSYQWYLTSESKNELIVGATTSIYNVPLDSTLSDSFKVIVTDSLNNTVTQTFTYLGLAKWLAGVNPKTQVDTIDSVPVAVSNNLRGTLHNYDNYYELLNAAQNYQRVTFGQIAFVHYDIPVIDPLTGSIQDQTPVKKYYKCNIQEPYTRNAVYTNVISQEWEYGKSNARYWVPTNDGPGSGASAIPIMTNNYLTGIQVTSQGIGYDFGEYLVVGIATNEAIDVHSVNPQVVDIDYANSQGILEITIDNSVGPFTTPPSIVIISGTYTTPTYPPEPVFEWSIGDSDAYDWQGVTFLNAEPDNDTIIIENGLVKATAQDGSETTWTKTEPAAAVISPTYDMSQIVGEVGITVLEQIIYPYQAVTLSLTAQNAGFVNTDLLNEVSTTITIKNIHVYADNFENICANTLGASSITLSAIVSDGTQSIMSSLGSITKASISQGFGNLSVTIDKTGLNQNHTVTIIAAATELGENNDRTHVVTASTQIQWCYNKYYLKDSNSTVSDTITIPNSAGRELSFVPQGSYDFPYTATPQYLWILLPTHMSVNHIGTADQSVPFYSDAGNNLITTNIIIVRNGQSQSYKGYRSYWPTAADYTVTI